MKCVIQDGPALSGAVNEFLNAGLDGDAARDLS